MKIKRINCYFSGCSKCINCTLVKKTLLGERLYVCKTMQKKHKEIEGNKCKDFRCKDAGESILCDNCSRGEDVKTYMKKKNLI